MARSYLLALSAAPVLLIEFTTVSLLIYSNSSGDVVSEYFCACVDPGVELIAISDDLIAQKPIYFIVYTIL